MVACPVTPQVRRAVAYDVRSSGSCGAADTVVAQYQYDILYSHVPVPRGPKPSNYCGLSEGGREFGDCPYASRFSPTSEYRVRLHRVGEVDGNPIGEFVLARVAGHIGPAEVTFKSDQ